MMKKIKFQDTKLEKKDQDLERLSKSLEVLASDEEKKFNGVYFIPKFNDKCRV
jgi:hypothetical protein